MSNREQEERKIFNFDSWRKSVGPFHWFRIQEIDYSPVNKIESSVLSLLDKGYFRTGEIKGTGFIIGEEGLILTANHIYMDRVREWGDISEVPVMIEGEIFYPRFELIIQDEKQDFVKLFSRNLKGRGLSKGQDLSLGEGGPYFVVGYPNTLGGELEHFPYLSEIAILVGEKLDKTSDYYRQEGIERQFLRCGAWPGFSGGPVVDKDGKVRAMIVSGTISGTESDYFDVLPMQSVEGLR